jgi:hypothetical protein
MGSRAVSLSTGLGHRAQQAVKPVNLNLETLQNAFQARDSFVIGSQRLLCVLHKSIGILQEAQGGLELRFGEGHCRTPWGKLATVV